MPEEITPQATPIALNGQPEWFPSAQDDTIAAPPQPPRRRPVDIFVGREGLRAGWALLLWFVFIAILGTAVNKTLHALLNGRIPKGTMPEWFMLSNSAILFLITGLAGLLVAVIERRRWTDYGINALTAQRVKDFLIGAVLGFGALSVLVAVLWKGGWLTFGGFHITGAGPILLWGFIFLLSFLFTGFAEEFTFRGFPQFTLTRGIAGFLRSTGRERHARAIAFWITAVLLAFVFGGAHYSNNGEGLLGLVSAGLIGLCFAFSLWRTGSLWWAIGFHMAWDWAESFFYGTADSGMSLPHRMLTCAPQGNPFYSGGTVGPEGSIFIFAIIALIAVLIAVTLKPRPGSLAAESSL